MAKGASKLAARMLECLEVVGEYRRAGARVACVGVGRAAVREIQTKLHRCSRSFWRAGCSANWHVRFGRRAAETGQRKRWYRAAVRPHNLVYHPDFLTVAWERVKGTRERARRESTGSPRR